MNTPPVASDDAPAIVGAPESLTPRAAGRRPERTRALAAMCASAAMFAGMGVCTKAATHPFGGYPALPGGEIALVRYLSGLIFLFGVSAVTKESLLGHDRTGLLWRGVTGGIASTCYFFGIQWTSLTNATLLNFTFVIWGPLFAIFSLGEWLGRRGLLAVTMALVGVMMVIHPETGHIRFGDGIALFSGIMAGAAVVQIRRLRQSETAYAVFFYFNLLGAPISLLAMRIAGTPLVLPALSQLPLLLGLGATSIGAQLLMTYGFREMTAAQGTLLTLTSVAVTPLLAHVLFAEPLAPTILFGGALILVSASTLALRPSPPSLFTLSKADSDRP